MGVAQCRPHWRPRHALLSLHPAPVEAGEEDIVDQALDLFKANILFKNYEMENEVDRVLVYTTLYIIECLKKLAKCPNKERARQDMYSFALEKFALPGESGFPLNAFFNKPTIRHETGARLVERVFDPKLTSD